jgi:hypothetical protein
MEAVSTMRRAQWFLMSFPMICGVFLLHETQKSELEMKQSEERIKRRV